MCGFIGFYDNDDYSTAELTNEQHKTEIAGKMGEAIAHRGPDSDGCFCDGDLTFGFRRLSIIDLAGGDQPMKSADERYVIVFNGEIYNYRELREEMTAAFGDEYKTNSDTETIIHAYVHYGEETAAKLRGMFAFVIYDTVEKSLYGARDYFGIKPFYYTRSEGAFIFGSEIKSFLSHPKFKKEVNPTALKLYLMFQYSPAEETIFKGVYKLAPGTYFTYRDGELIKKRYFTPEFTSSEKLSDEEAVRKIDDVVMSSVEYHQIADVEVGSFLSGGVDSSYIASTVRPMKTYSVGFDVEGFDETSLAAGLCKKLGMPNKSREITPDDFFNALPMVQYHSDEPHANLSAVPLYYLAQTAAEELKVVLSGEGADELFGGYDWYIQSSFSKAYRSLPLGLRKAAAKLGKLAPGRISRFLSSNATNVEDTYIGQAFIMNDDEANSLLKENYKSDISYKDITAQYYKDVKGKDDLTKKMHLDMNLWLPGDILLKADKMTMAHSLELRVPYLDREVWKVAQMLSSKQKMKGRHTKIAFRRAALSHIPYESAERKKAGFKVPIRVWLREEKYALKLKDMFERDFAAEFFDTNKLNAMLAAHVAGTENNARVLYTVYSFLLWYEQYFVLR